MSGHHLCAADGAPTALAQPRVDALRVEPVLAARQHPAPVAGAERLQAHRALAGAGPLLALVAGKLADLLGRKAAAAAFLRALPDAGRGLCLCPAAPVQRPEEHEDVDDEHHREAGDEEDDGVGSGHAIEPRGADARARSWRPYDLLEPDESFSSGTG